MNGSHERMSSGYDITIFLFRLSSMATYYIPRDGSLQSYKDYIRVLPAVDQPQAFGQHPNADITSLLSESSLLTATLQSLQTGSESSVSSEEIEEKVYQISNLDQSGNVLMIHRDLVTFSFVGSATSRGYCV